MQFTAEDVRQAIRKEQDTLLAGFEVGHNKAPWSWVHLVPCRYNEPHLRVTRHGEVHRLLTQQEAGRLVLMQKAGLITWQMVRVRVGNAFVCAYPAVPV